VPYEAASGARLRVSWYLYEDGAREWNPDSFHDVELHATCVPQTWLDGTLRCVPIADEAVFIDAACTMAVGSATTIEKPSYFIAYDGGRPAAVYRAGAATTQPAALYRQSADSCVGPLAAPDGMYFATTDVLPGGSLVELAETEVGDARLGARVRTATDGTRVPLALVDRELGLDCRVIARDTAAACEPTAAPAATAFADVACTVPALVTSALADTPAVVQVRSPDGCPSYHATGAELAAAYRREADTCTAIAPGNVRFVAVGDELALASVDRVVEAGRRLDRIVASDDGLTIAAGLFDTATHADCMRQNLGDTMRCIPTETLPAAPLYAAGCQVSLAVVAAPVRTCAVVAFATSSESSGIALHAIGDPYQGVAYAYNSSGVCQPYTPPVDVVLRALGPVLPLDTFESALSYGER